mmetsp:Transcript_42394/g.92691  ORF Transcript_42394/g.92691 Transcript_42394/m.92691 type:complete len:203 (-) Transcript_42394:461-1069(-)
MTPLGILVPNEGGLLATGGQEPPLHRRQVQPLATDLGEAIGTTAILEAAVGSSACEVTRAEVPHRRTAWAHRQVDKGTRVFRGVGIANTAHHGPCHEELPHLAILNLGQGPVGAISHGLVAIWRPQCQPRPGHRPEAVDRLSRDAGWGIRQTGMICVEDEPVLAGDEEVQQRHARRPASHSARCQGLAPSEDDAEAATLRLL